MAVKFIRFPDDEPDQELIRYSLGCVLYRMLTGELPFDGPTDAAVIHGQLYEEPVPVRDLRPDVPGGLEAVVSRLLAKRPEERPGSAEEVYRLLMPYVTPLEELPGTVQPGLSAWRMYAGVVGRVLTTPSSAIQPDPGSADPGRAHASSTGLTPASVSGTDPVSLGDLARARRQAERLTRESRYGEAARILTRVVEKAGPALGTEHSDVMGLRIELANILLTGGDYAKAVAFHRLSEDLARRDGPDADLVFHVRLQEANCHAALGQSDLALDLLERLLADQRRVQGAEDDRVTALREQIGLLLHGVGRTREAVRRLQDLAADLERRDGRCTRLCGTCGRPFTA